MCSQIEFIHLNKWPSQSQPPLSLKATAFSLCSIHDGFILRRQISLLLITKSFSEIRLINRQGTQASCWYCIESKIRYNYKVMSLICVLLHKLILRENPEGNALEGPIII